MKIHKRAFGSSTSLSYILVPQALYKALQSKVLQSKVGFKKCLIRCFLMGLPKWDNRLAACLEDSEKQQEWLRPLSGGYGLGRVSPEKWRYVWREVSDWSKGVRFREGLVGECSQAIHLGEGNYELTVLRPSALHMQSIHCLSCPRLLGSSAHKCKHRSQAHSAPSSSTTDQKCDFILADLIYKMINCWGITQSKGLWIWRCTSVSEALLQDTVLVVPTTLQKPN